MSANYAAGLSACDSKGKCGLPEILDTSEESVAKTKQLSQWMEQSSHCVLVIGAGISTAAGIPDFRGPKGIWTLEEEEQKPRKKHKSSNQSVTDGDRKEIKSEETKQQIVSLDDAKPTLTHLVIKSLVESKIVKYIISQNVDGLFLKTGEISES